jgi:hypothetical protein
MNPYADIRWTQSQTTIPFQQTGGVSRWWSLMESREDPYPKAHLLWSNPVSLVVHRSCLGRCRSNLLGICPAWYVPVSASGIYRRMHTKALPPLEGFTGRSGAWQPAVDHRYNTILDRLEFILRHHIEDSANRVGGEGGGTLFRRISEGDLELFVRLPAVYQQSPPPRWVDDI